VKLPIGWLKEHLDTGADVAALAEKLTMLGLQVEGVEDRAKDLAPFVVGHVVEAFKHPNADRLKLCRVDAGKGIVQVVCGAPNARTGMKGVFALPGARIPGTGETLKAGRIRGEESNGMLCSERELGLSDEHAGIVELPDDAPIGAPVAQVMGLTDAVLDISLTPNRGDCAAVRGLARDLAAAKVGTLKPLDTSAVKGTFASRIKWLRDFAADKSDACPYVAGRYFRGVKNGASPQWMQDRLRAVGLRPISALVDITQYVTLDLARPLHVFDAKKVQGDLTMRLARAGESIVALDGKTYALDAEMTVIADARGPQGIAGCMGGDATKVDENTTDTFLEVALFDARRTAATGRRLGIESDARYRFERGVDPTSADWGTEVSTRLILAICGGEASEVVTAGSMPKWERSASLRASRVAALGGVDLEAEESKEILSRLGFEVSGGEPMRCAIPPWRPDVEGEADLVEEVVRIAGYDRIPAVPLTRNSAVSRPALSAAQRRAGEVRRALAARGLVEAVTYSFLPKKQAELFGGAPDELAVTNPISADLDQMRPSVLPNLVAAARRNADRGMKDVSLFEVGPAYENATDKGQRLIAAGVRAGSSARHWSGKPRAMDALDAKADALAALGQMGAPVDSIEVVAEAPSWYHPNRSGTLKLGPTLLGYFGELHPSVLAAMEAEAPVAAFEAFLDKVPAPRSRGTAKPLLKLSPYQPVERDFAFVVDANVAAGAVLRAAKGADRAVITAVELFDVYEGVGVGAGRKSLAVSVRLQPTEATFTDAQIEAIAAKIVAAVTKATGATLRS
jgi:phenylalanyl-tRNA synthetase beta chain